jgi:hypothetical protein
MAQKNSYLFRGRISERNLRGLLRLFALGITTDRAAELTGQHHNITLALYRLLRHRKVRRMLGLGQRAVICFGKRYLHGGEMQCQGRDRAN